MFKRNIFVICVTILGLICFTSCDETLSNQPIMKTYESDNTITHLPPTPPIEDTLIIEKLTQDVDMSIEQSEQISVNLFGEVDAEDEVQTEEIIETLEDEIFEIIQEDENIVDLNNKDIDVTLVAQSTAVDDTYFQDALFIGDSILKGFKLFVFPYPNNVIAEQNAGLDQIYANRDVYFESADVKTTLWNAIDTFIPNPEKIYVLIGVNGIPGLENDQSMKYYEDLIVKLKERYPNKVMYVCAVTPLTKELSDKRAPSFSTEKLDDFNQQLYTLCQNQNVYYLQTDENLKDEDGRLLPEYDAGDGMHLNKAGHTVLFDYFKNHIVSTN